MFQAEDDYLEEIDNLKKENKRLKLLLSNRGYITIPKEDIKEIGNELLKRFGFAKDGAVDTKGQVKIFSFMEWLRDKQQL